MVGENFGTAFTRIVEGESLGSDVGGDAVFGWRHKLVVALVVCVYVRALSAAVKRTFLPRHIKLNKAWITFHRVGECVELLKSVHLHMKYLFPSAKRAER